MENTVTLTLTERSITIILDNITKTMEDAQSLNEYLLKNNRELKDEIEALNKLIDKQEVKDESVRDF